MFSQFVKRSALWSAVFRKGGEIFSQALVKHHHCTQLPGHRKIRYGIEDTRDCQGNSCDECRIRRRDRLPRGEVGGAKFKRHLHQTPRLNWPEGERNCDI